MNEQHRINEIDLKIRKLEEKQQKLFEEMGDSAFTYPPYINLQSQINDLEREKAGIQMGIADSEYREEVASKDSSVKDKVLAESMRKAQGRFYKMGKLKATIATVTGQTRKFNNISKKVKKGKMTVTEATQLANRMFR